MYIYIEGKEPVHRKSKSLAEMGVKDGDNLIVTTEMKLPFDVYSDEDDCQDGQPNTFPPTLSGDIPPCDTQRENLGASMQQINAQMMAAQK